MAHLKDRITSIVRKALILNQDSRRYGTFAEIGGGQEVARHFFRAGYASQTIAKTMSAYDMTVSDSIYGKADRYVSEARLQKMLNHEYSLLKERLGEHDNKRCFFVLANTVALFSGDKKSHGWMGVRIESEEQPGYTDIILHINLNDRTRLQQQETLGRLGVNLLYTASYTSLEGEDFLPSLIDEISLHSVEVNIAIVKHSENSLKNKKTQATTSNQLSSSKNQILNLEIVRQGLSPAALFSPQGEVLQASDCLFEKPIIVQRGTFRPITTTNEQLIIQGRKQFFSSYKIKKESLFTLMEISIDKNADSKDIQDMRERIEILGSLGYYTLVTQFKLDYELKKYLRHNTNNIIVLVMGIFHLQKIFGEEHYKEIDGGILKALSQLFDNKSFLYIYPYKSDDVCITASTFNPSPPNLTHLYKFLEGQSSIQGLIGCDEINTSLQSSSVRKLLQNKDSQWENMVPKKIVTLIKERKLFGYK